MIDQAINAAINQQWALAVDLNQQILSDHPQHVPSLNRLAKALTEIGEPERAKEAYQEVLRLDPFNPIAQKNLKLISTAHQNVPMSRRIIADFVEEPGKTKSYPLVRCGEKNLLQNLQSGQVVNLVAKKHTICVTTETGTHIGALPDDAAFYLNKQLKLGNQYQVVIKNVRESTVTIFMRELSHPLSQPVPNLV